MTWFDVDLLDVESTEFAQNSHNLVLRVFEVSVKTLEDEWMREEEEFRKRLDREVSEDERGMALQEHDWEVDLHRQRLQGIGALSLDWLMSLFKACLNRAKRYMDRSHPPDKDGYSGKYWLAKLRSEYLARFRIDFAKAPVSVDRFEELVFARNAGIHRDTGTLKEYLEKVKAPVFVDKDGQFFVARETLAQMQRESHQFVAWVVSELVKLRRVPTGMQPNGAVERTPKA